MSGRRQHFIPRFLQQGFAIEKSNSYFTWVYRKGARPFKSNIINVGLEGDFYTEKDDVIVDDLITEAESGFNSLLQDIRPLDGSVTFSDIPELFVHMEVRTRNIRQHFLAMGSLAVSKLFEVFSNENKLQKVLEKKFSNEDFLKKKILEDIQERGLPRKMLKPAMRRIKKFIPTMIEAEKKKMAEKIREFGPVLPQMLEAAAKAGHINSLRENVAPQVRVDRYKNLNFKVVTFPEGGLILGDAPVLFHIKGPKSFTSFLDPEHVLEAAILPISPQKVIIGSTGESNLTREMLRSAAARCSLEYFISAVDLESNLDLQREIGLDASFIPEQEAEEILMKILEEKS